MSSNSTNNVDNRPKNFTRKWLTNQDYYGSRVITLRVCQELGVAEVASAESENPKNAWYKFAVRVGDKETGIWRHLWSSHFDPTIPKSNFVSNLKAKMVGFWETSKKMSLLQQGGEEIKGFADLYDIYMQKKHEVDLASAEKKRREEAKQEELGNQENRLGLEKVPIESKRTLHSTNLSSQRSPRACDVDAADIAEVIPAGTPRKKTSGGTGAMLYGRTVGGDGTGGGISVLVRDASEYFRTKKEILRNGVASATMPTGVVAPTVTPARAATAEHDRLRRLYDDCTEMIETEERIGTRKEVERLKKRREKLKRKVFPGLYDSSDEEV